MAEAKAKKAKPASDKLSENRVGKGKLVTAFGDGIKDANLVVVTRQMGLNADETRQLRVQFHKEEVGFRVSKNTLMKIALKGTPLEALGPFLSGPTALAFSKDPIAAARSPSPSPRRTTNSRSSAPSWTASCSMKRRPRNSRTCRRSMSCAPGSSACWSPPPRASPACCRRRQRSSRA